ncbi:MAG: hypothetical protein ACXAC7_01765 [Candidatus Hodarchaeales archaeon]|jgi:predicted regulator of Ras-like GTPase activity (Roadblock/LC7/MglB family)
MSSTIMSEMQEKLIEIAKTNPEIQLCAFYNTDGLTLAFYSKNEIDEGGKMRYAATCLACSSLANRTLSTLTMDQVRYLVVKAENGNAGIGVTDKYYMLVITEKYADVKNITKKLLEIFK